MLRRALRGAVGVLLTTGALSAARPALAQIPGRPVPSAPHEEKSNREESERRLDEMKVNLALLSDPITFPFYLCARAEGGSLEVGGCVPADAVRQRALELAHRNTSLHVTDRLVIQANLNPRPPLRVEIMQKEGVDLLVRELGEVARQIHVEAQPDGLVALIGPIGSFEEKLAVSRLFRQVPGCTGVVNQLTVQPVLRDGRRVVQVTKDGSRTVPPAALGSEAEQAAGSTAPHWTAIAPAAMPEASRDVATPSPTRSAHSSDVSAEELRLPVRLSDKPHNSQQETFVEKPDRSAPSIKPTADVATAPSGGRNGPRVVDALEAPKPPAGWGHSGLLGEAQSKTKPVVNPTVALSTEPPAEHPIAAATAANPSTTSASDSDVRPSERPPLRSSRRWPPAFEARPAEPTGGRPGVIIFEDELAPPPVPVLPHATARTTRPAVLVDLVRKVNAVCGKQARDVLVEVQRDGSLLVKLKVAGAAEKTMMSKVLSIPEMNSPNVHLAVEVIP